jgi:bacterioferritin (cytochrome b1)
MEDFADIHALFSPKTDADGLSQVERLLAEFEAHEAKEEHALDQYKNLLAGVTQPVTRFVVQMIVSDEEKHRAVTHAMISTLKGSLTWTRPAGSLEGEVAPAAAVDELLAVTEEFLDLEKAGLREYKMLLKESADYYQGLFQILLNSMIRDSEKHVELLEFLRGRLKEQ